MAKQVQLRRGSASDHTTFTGAVGELTYVSDDKTLRIHDGSTAGGVTVGTGVINVKNYGATGDGVTDDTVAINNAVAASSGEDIVVPNGSYLYNTVVYNVDGDFLWKDSDFQGAVAIMTNAQNNMILLTAETNTDAVLDLAEAKIPLSVTVEANGGQHASGVRSNLYNKSTDGNGNTAFYGKAISDSGALWSAGLHGETRHAGGTTIGVSSESASYATGGALYGVVINNTTNGAETTHPITAGAKAKATTAVGCYILGSTNDTSKWASGIQMASSSLRSDGVGLQIDSDCQNGILLTGSYVANAIRIPAEEAIAFESSGQIKQKYTAADTSLGFWNGATNFLRVVTTGIVHFFNKILPNDDNTFDIGSASKRWAVIYAGTGTINTSDINEKQDIVELTVAEKAVAVRLKALIKTFRFKDAVEEKGNDARTHCGIMAQEVKEAFELENLDPHRYGLFCFDEWDTDSNQEAGSRYGIRYEELLSFIITAL